MHVCRGLKNYFEKFVTDCLWQLAKQYINLFPWANIDDSLIKFI